MAKVRARGSSKRRKKPRRRRWRRVSLEGSPQGIF
jgi:hypothetical protein